MQRRSIKKIKTADVSKKKSQVIYLAISAVILVLINFIFGDYRFINWRPDFSKKKIRTIHLVIDDVLTAYHIHNDWIEVKEDQLIIKYPANLNFMFLFSDLVQRLESAGATILESQEDMKTGRKKVIIGYNTRVIERLEFIPFDNMTRHTGKVAIIIDDFGSSFNDDIKQFLFLPHKITISILPGLKSSVRVANEANRVGKEVMVHLPMEPLEMTPDNGPFTILTSLDSMAIVARTQKALASIPHAMGINNHQGSKATSDLTLMRIFLRVIQKSNLYFVDSFTNQESVAFKLAQKMKVPCVKNMIFIDSEDDVEFIEGQFDKLSEMTSKYEKVIAIAHPRKNTLKVFEKALPNLEKRGINFVYVSELIEK